jgi:chemotaxis response regulator CheB
MVDNQASWLRPDFHNIGHCLSMARRILIADDSELMRRQIRKILESDRDLEICAEAVDGFEAVQKVQECCPDLAVIDFQMPVMNGLEATRKIKTLMPSVPVLILALESSVQLESEGKEAGAEAVLAKAEGSKRLSQVIHSLLGSN